MKLLFFVTEDWYFCSHRLPVARAAKDAGHDVVVVTRVQDHGGAIERAGLRLVPFNCARHSTNPFSELSVVLRLARIYRKERPDLVHHVAVKPVVYGSIAARLARIRCVVNALTGMGWLFSSQSRVARLLQPLVTGVLRVLLRRGTVIVQNPDDEALIRSLGLANIRLIGGSGVDPKRFAPGPEPAGVPVVMLVARLLWDKGVGEFVAAARCLRKRGIAARFVLVGAPDPGNPASVPEGLIQEWEAEGVIEWWGKQDEMPTVLAQAHIACLPSYREGVPKSLIEAAAAGLPVVTSDAPGCREIVADRRSGFLVPPRAVSALVDALQKLLNDGDLRRQMGEQGRALVLAGFTEAQVVSATLEVYRELFGEAGSVCPEIRRSDLIL